MLTPCGVPAAAAFLPIGAQFAVDGANCVQPNQGVTQSSLVGRRFRAGERVLYSDPVTLDTSRQSRWVDKRLHSAPPWHPEDLAEQTRQPGPEHRRAGSALLPAAVARVDRRSGDRTTARPPDEPIRWYRSAATASVELMAGDSEAKEVTGRPEAARKAGARARTRVPDHEIAEVRDVDFPVAMRGYERAAVDAYVSRVNRLLAELQISAAPESAIRHALDEVADETRGILARAHETADEITRRSRSQADDRLQRAEGEAEQVRRAADDHAREVRAAAEAQLRELEADAERIWQERDGILDDMRDLARELEQVAAQAAERYPARPEVQRRVTIESPAQAEDTGAAGPEAAGGDDGAESRPPHDDE